MAKFFLVHDSVTGNIIDNPPLEDIPDELAGYSEYDYWFVIDDCGELMIMNSTGHCAPAPSRYSISPGFYENFISSALNFIFQTCLECGGYIMINSNKSGICEHCNAVYEVESIKRKGKYEIEVIVTIKTPERQKKYLCRMDVAYRRIDQS